MDLRNTGLSLDMRRKFQEILLKNSERKKHQAAKKQKREKFNAMIKL